MKLPRLLTKGGIDSQHFLHILYSEPNENNRRNRFLVDDQYSELGYHIWVQHVALSSDYMEGISRSLNPLASFDSFQFIEHYRLFPKSLGEVLSQFSIQELHLSLTQGHWSYEKWGYPVQDVPPGAELWVWFQPSTQNIDQTWTDLINVLSGMFCASLNFLDQRSAITPHLAFRPSGAVPKNHQRMFSKHVRYATLPSETVCTENMTPWKKLLPCGARAGLSSLLNAFKLYDTSFHSLGVHVRPICMGTDCATQGVELTQNLAAVFDPSLKKQSQDWSFKKLFGRNLLSVCPLASSSIIMVDISSNSSVDNHFTLQPEPSSEQVAQRGRIKVRYAVYNIEDFVKNSKVFNLVAKYENPITYTQNEPPVLHVHRFQTGYGQENGGIMSLIFNRHPRGNLTINYLEMVPWFCRVYLHTLKIESFTGGLAPVGTNGTLVKPIQVHYVPGKDRMRPYHLELLFELPANSVTRLSFEFDRALLKWTEYPPDANHGFYIGSAVISTVVHTAKQYSAPPQHSSQLAAILNDTSSQFFLRLHTETLLITLPTPDFSMPYNVICLACTVVAIAFGSMHNLTTRKFVVKDPTKPGNIFVKLKEKFFKKKQATDPKPVSENVKGSEHEDMEVDQSMDGSAS